MSMNVYVMVDIEGISGVYSREQVIPGERRFAEGRKYMTEDINVCVKALKSAGVDKVYVFDCHGGSYAAIWEDLTEEADYYVCGSHDGGRMPGLDDCDALILLGYHAMAGTQEAVLEHTFNSKRVQNLYLNGKKTGEIGIDAAIAAEHGKKVIMVSGDDKTCAEAKEILPGVVTCEVKKGLNSFGAMLLPRQKAHQLLFDKTVEAVRNAEQIQPYLVEHPVQIKVEQMERLLLPNSVRDPQMEILDARSYQVTGQTVEEAFYKAMG